MARKANVKGYLKRHKQRVFRNQVFVCFRDTTYNYVQEQRGRLGIPLSHFVDYAVNELMKKKPPNFTKREYLNSFLVDEEERTSNEA